MLEKKHYDKLLAEHGKWISKLRDDVCVFGQLSRSIERRVTTLETNFAEIVKLYTKLDPASTSMNDELVKINSKIKMLEMVFENYKRRSSNRKQPNVSRP